MIEDTSHESSRGILKPQAGRKKFRLSRYAPAEELTCFVQRYWIVRWALDAEQTYTQETLPYPCVNLVVENGRSGIWGVVRQKFDRTLDGQGQVFGVKFRPGGFYPFLQSPVSELTDDVLRIRDVFDVDGGTLEQSVLCEDEGAMVDRMNAFLRARLPERDERVAVVGRIVDRIMADPAILKVEDLVARIAWSQRTLQRRFRRYVGVGPKWVIQRYRLQEAADRIAAGEVADWTKLALDLGYYDQAHFINDFKSIVGLTPAEYAGSMEHASQRPQEAE